MGCRVLPPLVGSPRRRRCSSTMRDGVWHRAGAATARARPGPPPCRTRETDSRPRPSETAELAHAWIALAAATPSRGAYRQPDLVAGGRPVDGLQHEIEREGELQLADDHDRRLALSQRHEIAIANLALDLEAELLEEALDRQIKARFQWALAEVPDVRPSMDDSGVVEPRQRGGTARRGGYGRAGIADWAQPARRSCPTWRLLFTSKGRRIRPASARAARSTLPRVRAGRRCGCRDGCCSAPS